MPSAAGESVLEPCGRQIERGNTSFEASRALGRVEWARRAICRARGKLKLPVALAFSADGPTWALASNWGQGLLKLRAHETQTTAGGGRERSVKSRSQQISFSVVDGGPSQNTASLLLLSPFHLVATIAIIHVPPWPSVRYGCTPCTNIAPPLLPTVHPVLRDLMQN